MIKTKEHEKTSGKELNEKSNRPNKTFKLVIMKMLTSLGRRVEKLSENFYKEVENIIQNK